MSVILRLQNLPWSATSIDIRHFFKGLSIPEGGVHIVGGQLGDAFIVFSTDEDARQAMLLNGAMLKEDRITLMLSSRIEMQKVIEMARNPQQNFMEVQKPTVPMKTPGVDEMMHDSDRRDNAPGRSRDFNHRDRRDRSRSRSRSRTTSDRGRRDTDGRRSDRGSSRRGRDSRRRSPDSRRGRDMDDNRPNRNFQNESGGWDQSAGDRPYGRDHHEMSNQNQSWQNQDSSYRNAGAMPFNQQMTPEHPAMNPSGPMGKDSSAGNSSECYYIQVKRLPPSSNHVDIKEFFRGISIAANGVQFVVDDSSRGKTTATAYVKLNSAKDQADALRRHKKTVGRNSIEVFRCSEKEYLKACSNPALAEVPKKVEDSPYVVLKGLPGHCLSRDISAFFHGLSIANIVVLTDNSGQASGDAFVEFSSISNAKSALGYHKKKLLQKPISVLPATAEDMSRSAQKDNRKPEAPAVRYPVSMQGLPFNASDRDITEFFSNNGTAPAAVYILLTGNGMATGEAFAEFPMQADAEHALTKNNQYMGLRQIALKPVSQVEMQDILSSTRHITSSMEHLTPNLRPNQQAEQSISDNSGPIPNQINMMLQDARNMANAPEPVPNQNMGFIPDGNNPNIMGMNPNNAFDHRMDQRIMQNHGFNSSNITDQITNARQGQNPGIVPPDNNQPSGHRTNKPNVEQERRFSRWEDPGPVNPNFNQQFNEKMGEMNNRQMISQEQNDNMNMMNTKQNRNERQPPILNNPGRNEGPSLMGPYNPNDRPDMKSGRNNRPPSNDRGEMLDNRGINSRPDMMSNPRRNSRGPGVNKSPEMGRHGPSNHEDTMNNPGRNNRQDMRNSPAKHNRSNSMGGYAANDNGDAIGNPGRSKRPALMSTPGQNERGDMRNTPHRNNRQEMPGQNNRSTHAGMKDNSWNDQYSGPGPMGRMNDRKPDNFNQRMNQRGVNHGEHSMDDRKHNSVPDLMKMHLSPDFHSRDSDNPNFDNGNMGPRDMQDQEMFRSGNDRRMGGPNMRRGRHKDNFVENDHNRHMMPTTPGMPNKKMDPTLEFGKPGCVVGASNIPFRAGVNEILDFFRGFGISKENVIRRFNENGMATGDARIAFRSNSEAMRSIDELNMKPLNGRPITLFIL